MKSLVFRTLTAVGTALAVVAPAEAALVLQPLASFGGGDGWLAPGEATHLQGASLQRGLTYNDINNHLYLVDRNGGTFVRILDGDTGALLGSLDATGVSGGTFALNAIDVAADGAIYAGNLVISDTDNFKVYRWANEGVAPTVAYDALSGLPRTGDTLAVLGAGAGTQIIASGSGSTTFARLLTGDGVNYAGAAVPVTGAPAGAFRLGLDFLSANTVVGKQTGTAIYDVGVGGGTVNVNDVNFQNETALDFDIDEQLLATVDFNSSDVRLYDGSDLSALTTTGFLDLANNTSAFVANGNGTGDLKFGVGPGGQLRLYVLNTNNGIQAFAVVPEPATLALAALGALSVLWRRR